MSNKRFNIMQYMQKGGEVQLGSYDPRPYIEKSTGLDPSNQRYQTQQWDAFDPTKGLKLIHEQEALQLEKAAIDFKYKQLAVTEAKDVADLANDTLKIVLNGIGGLGSGKGDGKDGFGLDILQAPVFKPAVDEMNAAQAELIEEIGRNASSGMGMGVAAKNYMNATAKYQKTIASSPVIQKALVQGNIIKQFFPAKAADKQALTTGTIDVSRNVMGYLVGKEMGETEDLVNMLKIGENPTYDPKEYADKIEGLRKKAEEGREVMVKDPETGFLLTQKIYPTQDELANDFRELVKYDRNMNEGYKATRQARGLPVNDHNIQDFDQNLLFDSHDFARSLAVKRDPNELTKIQNSDLSGLQANSQLQRQKQADALTLENQRSANNREEIRLKASLDTDKKGAAASSTNGVPDPLFKQQEQHDAWNVEKQLLIQHQAPYAVVLEAQGATVAGKTEKEIADNINKVNVKYGIPEMHPGDAAKAQSKGVVESLKKWETHYFTREDKNAKKQKRYVVTPAIEATRTLDNLGNTDPNIKVVKTSEGKVTKFSAANVNEFFGVDAKNGVKGGEYYIYEIGPASGATTTTNPSPNPTPTAKPGKATPVNKGDKDNPWKTTILNN